MSDERLTPEQGLVQMGAAMGAELALQVPDRALSERIMRQVVAAWDEGTRRAMTDAAARGPEPEPEPGTTVGTVRLIGPDEIRARRWAE